MNENNYLMDKAKYSEVELEASQRILSAFESCEWPLAKKMQNFPLFVRRQDIALFLARSHLFELTLDIPGCVVECGVFAGGGTMTWYHLSTILEPFNHRRRIIGFDSFEGFPSVSEADQGTEESEHRQAGGMCVGEDVDQFIHEVVQQHDCNRALPHLSKVELIKGDACKTIPQYVKDHQELLISLLYLDFDLYEPTLAALDALMDRVVPGGLVCFDELACASYPGETQALRDHMHGRLPELKRFPYVPNLAYSIKKEGGRQ